MDLNTWYYGDITYAKLTGGTTQNAYQVRIAYKLNSQSIENNTSNVTRQLQCRSVKSAYGTYGTYMTPTIDGNELTTQSKNIDMRNTNTWNTFATVTSNLAHNDNGTLTYSSIGSFETDATTGVFGLYALKSGSASAIFELPTIARASTIIATDTDIGTRSVITINKRDTSFLTTLEYKFASQTSYTPIITNITETTFNFLVPTSFYSLIPNSPSGVCTIRATTYNIEGNQVGEPTTATFTATANIESTKPVISNPTLVDTISKCINLTGNSSRLIRYISRAKITWTSTARYSSSLKSQKINNTAASSPYTFGNWSDNYTLAVTDTRDYTTTHTFTNTIVSYFYPRLLSWNIRRTTQTGSEVTATFNGEWYNGAFDAASANVNTLTVKYRYRESGASQWINPETTITVYKNRNNFSASNIVLGDDFDYRKSWQFEIILTDSINEPQYFGSEVIKGIPCWNAYEDANGNNFFNVNGDILSNNRKIFDNNPNSVSNTNANNYTNSGVYYLGSNSTNMPTDWCKLIVVGTGSGSDACQIAISILTSNIYVRTRNASSWGNWRQIAFI